MLRSALNNDHEQVTGFAHTIVELDNMIRALENEIRLREAN